MTDVTDAAAALAAGDLVVYPTETVYGLGANALDEDAVSRVFAAKGRDREKPVSLAVPDVATATEYTAPTAREREFMDAFLPGPVTVVVEKREMVPDILTAGRDRVGVRVPDHDVALSLLREFAPVTATSANVSGTGSVRELDALGDRIRDAAAVLVDGGATPGGGSTVVDVSASEVIREGPLADEIHEWLS
ncbi:L-threonylcarbamoyladenylate synthase [Halorientalis litorea]|jgi:L-threonylcarbamoyladenylate synthase|uniref:L-threonylcarbamoyladenylate synthase n=1 Tax=Halorientalis litorea TaxID=2931977 RepID=UPI001FF38555|nr:L-threonylcarbamoyladenylate synthase [Halorientalis litorea]